MDDQNKVEAPPTISIGGVRYELKTPVPLGVAYRLERLGINYSRIGQTLTIEAREGRIVTAIMKVIAAYVAPFFRQISLETLPEYLADTIGTQEALNELTAAVIKALGFVMQPGNEQAPALNPPAEPKKPN
jgi:hypothetical protein